VVAVSYGERLRRLTADDPDAPAFVFEETTLSRAALDTGSNRIARALAEEGVREGDLVSLVLPNGLELLTGMMAAWKLGAVPNPVHPRLAEAERAAILARAQPAFVVTEDWSPDPDLSDAPLPDRTPPNERALASGGSTGLPKLIIPSNPGVYDPDHPSRLFHAHRAVLVPGPLHHAVPFSAAWQAFFGGAFAVVMPRFDAAECLRLIEAHRIDRICVVPTMMLRIWRLPEPERLARDVGSLRFVLTGGAPCPAWLMRAWIEWLGPSVMHEAFGPSERIGGTVIDGHEWLAHPGSVGRVTHGSIQIRHPDTGVELPTGEVGEIWLLPATGPGSTYRYVGAESNRAADGWESVGDMGRLDADGYLHLADRRTDMILIGARNVYPAEVEAALESHPDVLSAAVIGLPDADLGSRIHALVETRGSLEPETLRDHVASRLARWKVPHDIERVETPLRDDAGKVRRSALRAARLRDEGNRG
jgi:bile acid-coenzyme A ligase